MKLHDAVMVLLLAVLVLGSVFVVCGLLAALATGFANDPTTLWCVFGGIVAAAGAKSKLERM